jgi:hypothetical protein
MTEISIYYPRIRVSFVTESGPFRKKPSLASYLLDDRKYFHEVKVAGM